MTSGTRTIKAREGFVETKKSSHADLTAQAFKEGVLAERERCVAFTKMGEVNDESMLLACQHIASGTVLDMAVSKVFIAAMQASQVTKPQDVQLNDSSHWSTDRIVESAMSKINRSSVEFD